MKTYSEFMLSEARRHGRPSYRIPPKDNSAQKKGEEVLAQIQKDNRKEAHEKKKAIGKAGVEELRKTQKANETERRMASSTGPDQQVQQAKQERDRKRQIRKTGAEELKKTQSKNRWDRRKERVKGAAGKAVAAKNTLRWLSNKAKSRGTAGQVSQSQRGGLAVRSTQIN